MYYKEGCLYPQCTPRSMCVFKAIIYRKKTVDCFTVTYEQKIYQRRFVCVVCHALIYFFSRMVFSSALLVVPKKNFFSSTMVATFGKY